jgi:hypothetical protein
VTDLARLGQRKTRFFRYINTFIPSTQHQHLQLHLFNPNLPSARQFCVVM